MCLSLTLISRGEVNGRVLIAKGIRAVEVESETFSLAQTG